MDHIDRIKELRKKSGLSQRGLSVELGLGATTYGNYEMRQRKMDIETLVKVCQYFGVSADELLGLK